MTHHLDLVQETLIDLSSCTATLWVRHFTTVTVTDSSSFLLLIQLLFLWWWFPPNSVLQNIYRLLNELISCFIFPLYVDICKTSSHLCLLGFPAIKPFVFCLCMSDVDHNFHGYKCKVYSIEDYFTQKIIICLSPCYAEFVKKTLFILRAPMVTAESRKG